jgi:beta-lactamase regulating signal transducer with metallopeptidase domain
MNGLIETINSLGAFFIDFATSMLILSSILIVVILGLDLVLRRRISAVCRYWIWMIILLKLVLPPTFSAPTSPVYWVDAELSGFSLQETVVPERTEIALPLTDPPIPESTLPQAPFVDSQIPNMSYDPGPVVTEEAHVAPPPALEVASLTWEGVLFLVWLVAVITLVMLLVQRTVSVGRLCAQSTKASADLLDILEQSRRQMGVRRRIALGLSPVVASPAVCGLFRPTIVLPQSLTAKLDTPSLRAILLHELVHIKRGDLWMSVCQAVLQIFYVYHPLLWLANVKIRNIREAAVDETVLAAMGEQAEEYPKTLVTVASLVTRRPGLSLRLIGVVESKKALAHRIRLITSRPFPKTAKIGMVGLLGITVVTALLLPMARAQKDESAVSTAPTSNVFTYEGQLELHKPLAVGIVAGTDDHPELVRIEWVRFEAVAAYSWGVTARVAWLPATESSWSLRVELLDREGRVLQHSRDEATVFTIEVGHTDQTEMQFADLKLDYMKFFGRSHARRFRIHLEPWQENVKKEGQVDVEAHTLEIQVVDQQNQSPLADAAVMVRTRYQGDASPYENRLSTTDLQGHCRIELPRAGLSSIYVSAQKQGFAAIGKWWPNDGSWSVSGTTLERLPQHHVLEMIRAGSAGGIVQDDQGQPLSAVEIRFRAHVDDPSGASGVSRSVQTDAEGRWQVDHVPLEVERISIGLRHAEYGGDNGHNRYFKGHALRDAWAIKHVEILKKGLTVTGKVLNDRGEPVPLATVRRVARGFNPLPTLTDESGTFRWACMADVSAYYEPPSLVVEALGYAPVWQVLDLTQRLDGLEFRLTRGRRFLLSWWAPSCDPTG